jgi:hypothetical protein
MHNEALRGLNGKGVPGGTSKQDRPKGNEVRRKKRPGVSENTDGVLGQEYNRSGPYPRIQQCGDTNQYDDHVGG